MKRITYHSKRFLLRLLFPVIVFIGVLTFIIIQSQLPHEMLRSYIQFKFKTVYKLPVTIKKIEGSLLNSLSIKDLNIYSTQKSLIATIPNLSFSYKPHLILLKQGLVSSIISDINVTDPIVYIHRKKDRSWNFQSLRFKSSPFHLPNQIHPIYFGNVHINNLTIHYQDDQGWGSQSLKSAFKTSITALNGNVHITDVNTAQLSLNGTMLTTDAPVSINASINPQKLTYNLSAIISQLPPSHWGPYVLPIKGYDLASGNIQAHINIRSKPPSIHSRLPFLYDMTFQPSQGVFKFPFFEQQASDLSGIIHIYQGSITPELLQYVYPKITPDQLNDVTNELTNARLLTNNYQLPVSLPKFPKHTKWIQPLLQSPPAIISFKPIQGMLYEQPTTINGLLDISNKKIKLSSKTQLSDFNDLRFFIKTLPEQPLLGKSTVTLTLKNQIKKPTLSGQLSSPLLIFKSIPIHSPHIDYKISKTHLSFTIKKGSIYNGILSGKGVINYALNPPQVSLNIDSTQLQGHQINIPFIPFIGTSNLHLKVTGTPQRLHVHLNTSSSNISLYSQQLHLADASFETTPTQTLFLTHLYLNQLNTPLSLEGRITTKNTALHIKANTLPLKDINPFSTLSNTGKFNTDITLTLPSTSNSQFIFDHATATGSITIKEFPFYGQKFNTLTSIFKHHHGKTVLESLKLRGKNNQNNISIKGSFSKHPLTFLLDIDQFNFGNSKLVEYYVPDSLKPFGGVGNLKLNIDYIPTPTISLPKPYDWLAHYQINGHASIEKLRIQNQPFNHAIISGHWDGKNAFLKKINLSHINTSLGLKGNISNTGTINFKIKDHSTLDIANLHRLFKPWGSFSGKLYLNGSIQNTLTTPHVQVRFEAKHINSPTIKLDHLSGDINHLSPTTHIKSLVIKQNNSQLSLKGHVQHVRNNESLSLTEADIETHLSRLNLETLKELTKSILSSDIPSFNLQDTSVITNYDGQKPSPIYAAKTASASVTPLYYRHHYTQAISSFNELTNPPQKTQSINTILTSLKGHISGKIHLTKLATSPLFVNSKLSVHNGTLGPFQFNVGQILLSQSKTSQQFSLSFLNGSLNGNPFNKMRASGHFKPNGVLTIDNTSFNSKQNISTPLIVGHIPISEFWAPTPLPQPLSVTLSLTHNQINVLSLLHTNIETISNQGNIIFSITGTLQNPVISAPNITLKNASIKFKESPVFNNAVSISTANISLKNNQLSIKKLSLVWKNTAKKRRLLYSPKNTLSITGNVTVKQLDFKTSHFTLQTRLNIKDTSLSIMAKNQFQGTVDLSQVQLNGHYANQPNATNITESKTYPTLSGHIYLKDSNLQINSNTETSPLPMIPLQINASIGNNVFVNASSSLGKSLVSGFAADIELSKTPSPIRITGTLPYPVIHDDIHLKEGAISILNRNFELLSQSDQRPYLRKKSGATLPHKNTFRLQRFSSSDTSFKVVPIVNISALTIIDTQISGNTSIDSERYRHLFVTLEGPMDQLQTFDIDHFNSPIPIINNDISYVNTYQVNESEFNSDQSELAQVVMPELNAESQGSSQFISGIGETRINYLIRKQLLRPIEKEISSQVGLEDLRIDYNFGSAFLDAENHTKVVGINAMKGLSKRLYLRVKSNIDLESDSQQKSFKDYITEIELTYLILKNLTLNYSNGKDTLYQDEFKSKVSLRYTHEF